MSGKLFVVGTPIGNLGDFSPRAVQTLSQCDFIAAEDTRVTLKLLNHFEIKKPMISYFEHNRREKGGIICDRILAGESCALVTDAGMPAVSDPGEELVALCHERGIPVCAVPGPSAFVAAIALSGLPVGRFTFEGFLSVNKQSRREHLEQLKNERRTMVFYEAPHKLTATLGDLFTAFGDRRIALVREITKIHEQVVRTTLAEAAERYKTEAPRGEFVLVVEGAAENEKEEYTLSDAVELARAMLFEGLGASLAAKQAAKQTGIKKGDIYKALSAMEEKMNGFIAWVTEYWKYLVFLVIAVIAAVIVFVKSNKAYSAYYARYRTEEEQMKHLVEMKERFSPLTKEIIASASEEELLMGAALAYQVKIQKQDNIDEAFMLLTDEKKYVYTLDVFVSDESVGVFFRENGSQLKNLLVPALEMIGMPDTAKRAEKIRLMFDEKDETVSFSEKRIAEMQEYIDSGDILTKIKLHSAQYIKANPEKFI